MAIKRSGFEDSVCADLDNREVEYKYEEDTIPYVVEHNYWPDIKLANGIYIEIKGRLLPKDRTKTRAVLAQNPNVDLRFCFQRSSNYIYRGSKTTYGQWCDKLGIPWCEGTIPQEWINEKKPRKRKRAAKRKPK